MTNRIIRITECAQCPHAAKLTHAQTGELSAWWCQSVMSRTGPVAFGEPICPPEGTPEWCPLERLDIPDSISEETLAPFTKIGAYYVGRRAAIEDMEQERLEPQPQAEEMLAAVLIRTIVAEAERTGSWELPGDVKEWMLAFVAGRDRGKR